MHQRSLFGEDISAQELVAFAERPLTIVSDDFLAAVDKIGFSGGPKKEFFWKMLSFSPSERLQTINELLLTPVVPIIAAIPKKDKKQELEGVLIYEDLALDMIREYLEKHRSFDPIGIISYLNSRFSKTAVNINENRIRRIMKSLIEKNIVVEGSILARKDVLQNDNRRKIFKGMRDHPGIHINKLVKEMHMPTTVIRWHLKILDKFSFIQAERVGNRLVYYDKEKAYPNAKVIHLISQVRSKKIIESLELHSERCLLTEMSRELGMHYTTVKKYVSKLETFDIVSSKQTSVYFINEHKLREILDAPAVSPEN